MAKENYIAAMSTSLTAAKTSPTIKDTILHGLKKYLHLPSKFNHPSHTTILFYHSEYIWMAPSDCWTSHTTMEPTPADPHQQQPTPPNTPCRGHLEQKDQHNTNTPSTLTMEYPLFRNPSTNTKHDQIAIRINSATPTVLSKCRPFRPNR